MKKQILQMACVLLGMMLVSNVFAKNQLRCEEFLITHWVDANDTELGQIALKYYWLDDPYTLEYDLRYYGKSFDIAGVTTSCTAQSDGSVLIIMNLDRNYGYLALQANDMNTLTVLPGSHLLDKSGKQTSVAGPFVRG